MRVRYAPFFEMVFNALALRRTVSNRFSSGTQMRFFCRFTLKRRLVIPVILVPTPPRYLALPRVAFRFPDRVPAPVIWHRRAIFAVLFHWPGRCSSSLAVTNRPLPTTPSGSKATRSSKESTERLSSGQPNREVGTPRQNLFRGHSTPRLVAGADQEALQENRNSPHKRNESVDLRR